MRSKVIACEAVDCIMLERDRVQWSALFQHRFFYFLFCDVLYHSVPPRPSPCGAQYPYGSLFRATTRTAAESLSVAQFFLC
jgi:hypothetical protein